MTLFFNSLEKLANDTNNDYKYYKFSFFNRKSNNTYKKHNLTFQIFNARNHYEVILKACNKMNNFVEYKELSWRFSYEKTIDDIVKEYVEEFDGYHSEDIYIELFDL